jgi:NAD+ synthase (glutamine-hydrolysing)
VAQRVALSRGEQQPIPINSISKEPSAELRPDQKDSDSLPSYDILDQLLTIYIENDGGCQGCCHAGFDPTLATRVIQMVDQG